MKKGFTLIELLAVLLILAVIALIAVPIVLNIIKDSKNNANLMSAKMYVEAANKSIMNYSLNTKFPDTTCNILDGGNLRCDGIDKEIEIGISNGSQIKSGGIVTIENREVKEIFGLIVDDIVYDYKNGSIGKVKKYKVDFDTTGGSTIASQEVLENRKIVMPSNPTKDGYVFKEWRLDGEVFSFDTPITNNITLKARWRSETEYVLTTGCAFNKKLKALADGITSDQVSSCNNGNSSIKSVTFYSSGNLPEGYTKDDLNDLPSRDVSNNNKKTIMAYNDGEGNIFIYSDGQITMNNLSDTSSSGYYTFYKFNAVKTIDLSELDMSNLKSANSMFESCSQLTNITFSSDFSVSNIVTMSNMFSGCSKLTELNLTMFDTYNVKNMGNMLSGCSSLTELDVSSFDTSNVTNMSGMFSGCTNLKELDLSNFRTGSVTQMSSMFSECTNLTKVDLSSFDTKLVQNMSGLFLRCTNIETIDLSNFETPNLTNIQSMFQQCTKLKEVNLQSADFDYVSKGSYFLLSVPTKITIYLKDTEFNRNFMSTNYSNYTPTYIAQ